MAVICWRRPNRPSKRSFCNGKLGYQQSVVHTFLVKSALSSILCLGHYWSGPLPIKKTSVWSLHCDWANHRHHSFGGMRQASCKKSDKEPHTNERQVGHTHTKKNQYFGNVWKMLRCFRASDPAINTPKLVLSAFTFPPTQQRNRRRSRQAAVLTVTSTRSQAPKDVSSSRPLTVKGFLLPRVLSIFCGLRNIFHRSTQDDPQQSKISNTYITRLAQQTKTWYLDNGKLFAHNSCWCYENDALSSKARVQVSWLHSAIPKKLPDSCSGFNKNLSEKMAQHNKRKLCNSTTFVFMPAIQSPEDDSETGFKLWMHQESQVGVDTCVAVHHNWDWNAETCFSFLSCSGLNGHQARAHAYSGKVQWELIAQKFGANCSENILAEPVQSPCLCPRLFIFGCKPAGGRVHFVDTQEISPCHGTQWDQCEFYKTDSKCEIAAVIPLQRTR